MGQKYQGFDGLDYIRNSEWEIEQKTLKGWQKYIDKIAKNRLPKGRWHGVVTIMENKHYTVMLSIGGM